MSAIALATAEALAKADVSVQPKTRPLLSTSNPPSRKASAGQAKRADRSELVLSVVEGAEVLSEGPSCVEGLSRRICRPSTQLANNPEQISRNRTIRACRSDSGDPERSGTLSRRGRSELVLSVPVVSEVEPVEGIRVQKYSVNL